jgi:cob(I)alamin adenosyltransferase
MLARLILWGALVFVLSGPARLSRAADDIPYWPSDQEERLRQVEHDLLDVQRDLAAARLNNDEKQVEKLSKQYKKIQDERVKLMRTNGQLPAAKR